jgi:hypothetical protein
MNRRTLFKGFAATAAGLLVPEPVRAYSFVGGWVEHTVSRSGCIGFGDAPDDTIRIKREDNGVKTLAIDWDELKSSARWSVEFTRSRANGVWTAVPGTWKRPEDFGT